MRVPRTRAAHACVRARARARVVREVPVRRLAERDHQHALESQLLGRHPGTGEVPDVRGVEAAPEDPERAHSRIWPSPRIRYL